MVVLVAHCGIVVVEFSKRVESLQAKPDGVRSGKRKSIGVAAILLSSQHFLIKLFVDFVDFVAFLISNRDVLGNLSSAAVVTARSAIYIPRIGGLRHRHHGGDAAPAARRP